MIFKNVTLVDGTGTPPQHGVTVVVKDNRIESIGTDIEIPDSEYDVIDLKGKFMLPGLIDAHVHFGGTDRYGLPGISGRKTTDDYFLSRRLCLRNGITTVRSAGDFVPDIYDVRNESREITNLVVRIFAAGKGIQVPGGHPLDTVLESDKNIRENETILVVDETDIDKEIKALVDLDTDWIKTFISEVNQLDFPKKTPRLSPERIKEIIQVSHKYGKPCMVHIDNISQMREAAEAGADSIEHVFCKGSTDTEIDDDLIEMLLEKNISIIPTMYSIKQHDCTDGSIPQVFETLVQEVHKLIEAGVHVCVGTDGSIPLVAIGESMSEELALLVEAGMTPLQAITAATGGNARLLNKRREKEIEIGTLLPGKLADFIVIDEGNPLEDISNIKNVDHVVLNGNIVWRKI